MIICKRTRTVAKVTFVLPFDDPVGEVCVVGDFNDWQPDSHRLTRSTYGTRAVTILLPLNQRYTFRYVTDSGRWFDDPDVQHTGDLRNILTTDSRAARHGTKPRARRPVRRASGALRLYTAGRVALGRLHRA